MHCSARSVAAEVAAHKGGAHKRADNAETEQFEAGAADADARAEAAAAARASQ